MSDHEPECLLVARCIGGQRDPDHAMFDEGNDYCLDCGESCQCALIRTVRENALEQAAQRIEKLEAFDSGIGFNGEAVYVPDVLEALRGDQK